MAERVPTSLKKERQRLRDLTWKELEKRGYDRPKTAEENARRLKEAHGS